MKVLIVDDSPIARKILKKCLPSDGTLEIVEAENGQVGVEKYAEVRPDVTFMDLTMPVMDGFQAIEHIMREDNGAMIVAASADIQIKAIKQVLELGAFMVLRKPFSKEKVEAALAKARESVGRGR